MVANRSRNTLGVVPGPGEGPAQGLVRAEAAALGHHGHGVALKDERAGGVLPDAFQPVRGGGSGLRAEETGEMPHAHSSLGRHAGDGVLDGRIGLNGFHQPTQAALPGHRSAQSGGERGLAARPLQERHQLLRHGRGRLRPGVLLHHLIAQQQH